MRLSPATLGGAAMALALLVTSPAQADLVHWHYSWSRSPAEVLSDTGQSKVTLSDESLTTAEGSSDIVATNLRTFSTADPHHLDTFTHKGYTLTLKLIDDVSHQSGTLVFKGEFNGTVSSTSANIINTFTSLLTRSIVLGDNLYIATMNSFVPPGPPGASNSGSIGAHVDVTVVHLPEPASLTLLGLGAGVFLLVRRRRKRDEETLPA
jgi:hypothetical protein